MCALIYRGQANKTGVKAFCFNGDILFHLKCEKFKASLRFPAHTEPEESFSLTTKDALSRATFGNMTFIEDFFSRVGNAGAPRDYKEIEKENIHYRGNLLVPRFQTSRESRIGELWGAFYYCMFKELGITHYRYIKTESTTEERSYFSNSTNFDYLIVSFYKKNETPSFISYKSIVNNEKLFTDYDLVFNIYLKILNTDVDNKNSANLGDDESGYIPYEFFDIFRNSVWYIDDTIVKYDSVIKGEYQYPLIDFLYFSAVTISTLGYGDILPNNTFIRKIVVFESFFGVFLLGGIITLVFSITSELHEK